MSGRQTLHVYAGSTVYPCRIADQGLKTALLLAGFNPSDFNRITWPMGASNHARGTLLMDRDTLDAIVGDDVIGGAVEVRMGDEGSTVNLQGMYLLPPRPLLVGTGARLYAVPVVCGRYYWQRDTVADANYNCTRQDRSQFDPETIDDGDPWQSDQILSALFADIGISPTIADSDSSVPWECQFFGHPAAAAIDRICAETGRVFAYDIDTTASVEYIDTTNVSDVLNSHATMIVAGSITYQAGSPNSVLQAMAVSAPWQTNEVPENVSVTFPVYAPQDRYQHTSHIIVADVDADGSGLNYLSGYTIVLSDLKPALYDGGGVINGGTLTDRADELATAYYRRWLCGGCDVLIAGIVNPAKGGGAQVIEWICDGTGFYTRVVTDPHWPTLGFPIRATPVFGSSDMRAHADAAGGVLISRAADLTIGYITSVTTTDNYPSDTSYGAVEEDPDYENLGDTMLQPICRVVEGSVAKIVPAEVGDPVILRRGLYVGNDPDIYEQPEIMLAPEPLLVVPCEVQESVAAISLDRVMLNRDGTPAVNRDYTVSTDRYASAVMNNLADRWAVNRDYEPAVGRDYEVAWGRQIITVDDITAEVSVNRDYAVASNRDGTLAFSRNGA